MNVACQVAPNCWDGGDNGDGSCPLSELLERAPASAAGRHGDHGNGSGVGTGSSSADFKLQSVEGSTDINSDVASVVLSLAAPFSLRPTAYSLRSGSFFEPQVRHVGASCVFAAA